MNFTVKKYSSYAESLPANDRARYQVKLATVRCDIDPYSVHTHTTSSSNKVHMTF